MSSPNATLIPDKPLDNITHLEPELKAFTENLYKLLANEINQEAPAIRSLLLAGDWGTGKTSTLNAIKSEFAEKNNDVVVIFFEAWRYEYEDNLLLALLWKIADCAGINLTAKTSRIRGILDGLVIFLAKLWSGSSVKKIAEDKEALEVDRFVNKTVKSLSVEVSIDRFITDFYKLISKLFDDKKVLFLIDDLDRCSPESALTFLEHLRRLINVTDDSEALKLSLGHKLKIVPQQRLTHCFFLAAMDKTTLKQAIQHKFADLSNYDSNRYLEKLFPLTLQIPIICSFDNRKIKSLFEAEAQIAIHEQKITAVFSQQYFKNSRLLIRCINQVKVILLFGGSSLQSNGVNSQAENVVTPQFFEWLAAINRWPELRQFVNSKDAKFWNAVEKYLTLSSNDLQQEMDSFGSLVTKNEIVELMNNPGLGNFLKQSVAFGDVDFDARLENKLSEWRNNDKLLQACGL